MEISELTWPGEFIGSIAFSERRVIRKRSGRGSRHGKWQVRIKALKGELAPRRLKASNPGSQRGDQQQNQQVLVHGSASSHNRWSVTPVLRWEKRQGRIQQHQQHQTTKSTSMQSCKTDYTLLHQILLIILNVDTLVESSSWSSYLLTCHSSSRLLVVRSDL